MEWFVLFRGVERWLIVLAAMLCLWLSTRVPQGIERSQGKLKWQGYLIELKNVGPNVFFAGFGAFILIVSLFAKLDNYQSTATRKVLRRTPRETRARWSDERTTSPRLRRRDKKQVRWLAKSRRYKLTPHLSRSMR